MGGSATFGAIWLCLELLLFLYPASFWLACPSLPSWGSGSLRNFVLGASGNPSPNRSGCARLATVAQCLAGWHDGSAASLHVLFWADGLLRYVAEYLYGWLVVGFFSGVCQL